MVQTFEDKVKVNEDEDAIFVLIRMEQRFL
jgi:hypothetical protein